MVEGAGGGPKVLAGERTDVAGIVLIVDEDGVTRELVAAVLRRNGFEVLSASDAGRGSELIAAGRPDLVISDVATATSDGRCFLTALRSDERTKSVPFIVLTEFGGGCESITGFDPNADGSIVKPVRPPELVARVRAILAKGSHAVESESPVRRRQLLGQHAFAVECRTELERANHKRLAVSLACLELFELSGVRETVGARAEAVITREIAQLIRPYERVAKLCLESSGRFLLWIESGGATARELLNDLSRTIVEHRFHVGPEPVRLTPIVGFATRTGAATLAEMRRRADFALGTARLRLDLQAVRYDAASEEAAGESNNGRVLKKVASSLAPFAIPLQVVATFLAALALPFSTYWILAARGLDITYPIYVALVVVLLLTALGIWCEDFLALKVTDPPVADVYPPASAIIAAYLPNEAATVIETIEAFLRVQYAADIQVILAYNTPRSLPMEEELRAIARRDPRFVALRVRGSTSKAQNVNAALHVVRGAFVGVFDADHKPDPGSFTRAWNWLAGGYDIVQGHCMIRNGDESLVAQLVAIEFESIYAVSHPGRTRMHGFGLFGGSNGYWKTDLLRQTRMHQFMLTEDIDSSLRVIEAGYRIASDPKLISRELAPLGLRAFWHQRLRWAQGWFQVSLRHLVPALKSPHLDVRQKFGILHLLLWRECYVWLCLQLIPILTFWVFVRHETFKFFIPIFALTTILTTLTGPVQLLFTYLLAQPEIRERRGWFWTYLIASFAFFSELKNVVSRLAHFKEAMRERAWKVTPRSSGAHANGRAAQRVTSRP